jgi:hypothetical protein
MAEPVATPEMAGAVGVPLGVEPTVDASRALQQLVAELQSRFGGGTLRLPWQRSYRLDRPLVLPERVKIEGPAVVGRDVRLGPGAPLDVR